MSPSESPEKTPPSKMRKTMMAHCDDIARRWGVLMGRAVKVSERWQAGDERKKT